MPKTSINGIELSYEIEGDDEGAPVVFVAGLGQPAMSWRLMYSPRFVDAGYRVITFDNRGVPPSDCPEGPYSVAEMASDAAGLVESLELGAVHLVGYSLGSWIAEELSIDRPDLVRSVVFLAGANPSSSYEKIRYPLGAELAARLDPYPRALDTTEVMQYLTQKQLQDDSVVDGWQHILELDDPWSNPGRLGQWQAAAQWCNRPEQLERYAKIQVPALVVAFETDIDSPPAMAEAAAEAMPDGELVVVSNAGHMGVFERSMTVIGAITNFIHSH